MLIIFILKCKYDKHNWCFLFHGEIASYEIKALRAGCVSHVWSYAGFADQLSAFCEAERSEHTKVRQVKGRWDATG